MTAPARQAALQRLPISPGDVRVGTIVELIDGRPIVALTPATPAVAARVAYFTAAGLPSAHDWLGSLVLLLLEEGDPRRPIIIGLLGDTLPGFAKHVGTTDVEVEGRRVALEGHEQVELRCGDASITLRADGHVIVKGTRVVSRASESNKIRGATVLIN